MDVLEQMRLFMEPESIALVGVSRSTDHPFGLLRNLLAYGFSGDIYPVNPSADQILGVRTYPAIKDLPDDIDLTVIMTPRDTTLALVEESVEKGLKAIIIVAQGFGDADEKGKSLQSRIIDTAKRGGARIIGPNTFGVTNAFQSMSTALPMLEMERSPIGIISQTGIPFLGTSRFKFGKIIDIGDTCDIDVADALCYFEEDPEITVVALQIEGIQDGRRFAHVVGRVVKKKPVLVLKGGRSEAGARAALSHTGSIAGADEVYDATFKQRGLIRVNDLEELEDMGLAFSRLPPMKKRGVGVMSWAGSTGVLTVDACDAYGLEVPLLSDAAIDRIRELSPPAWLPIENPVDLWACAGLVKFDAESLKFGFRTIMEALLNQESIGAVLVIIPDFHTLFQSEDWDISEIVHEVAEDYKEQPIVFSILGAWGKTTERLEEKRNMVVFRSHERAVRALSRLWEYAAISNPDSRL